MLDAGFIEYVITFGWAEFEIVQPVIQRLYFDQMGLEENMYLHTYSE